MKVTISRIVAFELEAESYAAAQEKIRALLPLNLEEGIRIYTPPSQSRFTEEIAMSAQPPGWIAKENLPPE